PLQHSQGIGTCGVSDVMVLGGCALQARLRGSERPGEPLVALLGIEPVVDGKAGLDECVDRKRRLADERPEVVIIRVRLLDFLADGASVPSPQRESKRRVAFLEFAAHEFLRPARGLPQVPNQVAIRNASRGYRKIDLTGSQLEPFLVCLR